MSRGEDAHVGAPRLDAADTLERPFLQHAQQLHLHVEAHVADLVEEQRAPCGQLEAADPRGKRAGEGTLFMTEQLGLEQLARNCGAIDRHEGPAARPDSSWIRRATSSLPQPDSPWIRTVLS